MKNANYALQTPEMHLNVEKKPAYVFTAMQHILNTLQIHSFFYYPGNYL